MEVDSLNNASKYSAPAYTPAEPPVVEQPRTAESVGSTTQAAKHSSGDSKQMNATAQDEKEIADKTLKVAVEEANKKLIGVGREFQYSIHDKTKQIMIKLVDKETKEVIREIPPEKIMDAIGKMWELAGILLDAKK